VIPCAYKKPKVVRPWFQFLKKVLEISVQTAGLEKTQKVLPPNYVKECLNKIFSHEIKNDEEKEGDKKVREKTPQHKKLLDCATLLSTKHFLEIFVETGKPPQNPKKRAREGDGTVDSPTSKKQKVSHSHGKTEHTLDTAETKANEAAAKKAAAEKSKKKKDKRAELQQRKREKKIRKAVKRGKPIPPVPVKPKKNKLKYEKNKERNRLRKIEAKKKLQDKH